MEIREFLLQAGVRKTVCGGPYPNPESPPDNPPPPPSQRCCKAGGILIRCISRFWTKYIKVDPVWLREVRGHLITAATLTATMAYQSILSPPGGLWQENKDGHVAGKAILDGAAGVDEGDYLVYFAVNSIVLIASLSTIMLAMTGFPIQNKLVTWLMIFTVYVTISCMGAAYVTAVALVSPNLRAKLLETAGNGMSYGWVGLLVFVLLIHSCRLLVWLGSMLVKLVKACNRWWVPRATRNNISTSEVNPAGRP
ncbi:hypothetical protein Vadar_023618 [Vaccinium darrowii]|uniref:Uncharacterized protein n=1 Tax=Vaccinium darrowii TaxID=229202 RepID=A0ACB7YY26_9ERIC|nr:hypothetical protein Vadar_023618 [Vaccinium darrowii]